MINILGVGLDYLMLKDDSVRGDVRRRQFEYAKNLQSLNLVVYSPRSLGLKPQQWADNLWVYPTNSGNKITFVLDALRIASKICQQKKIDVITAEDPFTTGFIGRRLKRKFSIPLNIQVHNDFCDNRYWMGARKINRIFNKLGKFNLTGADTIRVGTNYEKEKLSRILNVSEHKISVIPVNSDISRFRGIDADPIREDYLGTKFNKMLLFTGRLVKQKDIPTLLKALGLVLRRRPSTLLLIVGSGAEEASLRGLAKDLGVENNVVFTGSIEHKRIPEFVSACDVYTISSIFEGTCIAMVEAMAAGKPVVATGFAGARDLIIDGETGFVVKQKDYRSFADRILYLLNNFGQAGDMGRKALACVERIFTGNRNIEEIIKLWEQTATHRPH